MIIKMMIAVLVLGLVIFGIGNYLSPDDLKECSSVADSGACRKADAIVVISGGDTIGRTDEAIDLYKNGWAKYIIFSGAAADKNGPSNALVMQDYAVSKGISEEVTYIEEISETTKQNAKQVKEQLNAMGVRDVILVTSQYHLRRASLEFASQLGDGIDLRRHPALKDNQWSGLWWLTPWGWWIAIGELVKIGVFYVGGSR